MVRVPTYYQDLIDIIYPEQGHVIGSTACLGGWLATAILQEKDKVEIAKWLNSMVKLFGKDNFYLELQPSATNEQTKVNRELINLSKELGIPYIITTDSHYLKKEDAPIHKAFLNSQDGEREVDSFYATTYLMNTDELESKLDLTREELDIAYQNILNIKDSCEDFSLLKPLKIPELIWKKYPQASGVQLEKYIQKMPELKKFIDSGYRGDNILVDAIIQKLENNKDEFDNEETYVAIDECLRMTWESSEVNKTHWSAYYLNLQKIIDTCWEAGSIILPGRGSGVGFILLYILDITQINPLREDTKTVPWRFLNPSRVSVLDVDFDIEGTRRADVLNKFREVYGEDRVANVITFGTEKSKSAILTAARGLGIDVDEAQYIASLVPADRGLLRTLHQCYYGDKENGFKPIGLFVKAMNDYPELWQVAQKVEGLISRSGIHAGGVIFVDEPFTNTTSLMRAPDGTIVTALDLHDAEAVSMIKYDALSVEAADKIHTCLDLLCEAGHIERKSTLKETYDSVLNIYKLERNDPKMWEMVWNHEIFSLFQMEKQSGIQGIALTKPSSVEDLAHLNSVIRLMAQSRDAEQPLNKYARFKENINEWYKEMDMYGLTKTEQELLKPIVESSYGIAESQESFMQLVQIPECGGFDLNWADRLRKAIAKKNPAAYEELEKEYFETVKEKGLSQNLCNYVWNVLVATSRGYGFNLSHTLAYSLVALQEMNLAYKYPIIYWNCACLMVDSGSLNKDQNTNYGKLATAISKMRDADISISLVDINNSSLEFIPDEKNNTIWYGLKGLVRVGDKVINPIVENRPYKNIKDFCQRVKIDKLSMISLIKGGAFDTMHDRKFAMAWYLWETCDKKNKITLQNMSTLIKKGLIPCKYDRQKNVFEFNRYLKTVCKDGERFRLDERAINFLANNFDNVPLETKDNVLYLDQKVWDKQYYQKEMDIVRDWMRECQADILYNLNMVIFQEQWDKYAAGTISKWEMEVLGFYYHEHELANIDFDKYGIVDFNELLEEPIVDRSFTKGDKVINLYKLQKIIGTCISKDKQKGLVTLLTPTGVVEVKFDKTYMSIYDKQISTINPDGTKTVVERSWFNRGQMIMVQGIRRGELFIPKKYSSTPSERLYHIDAINNGSLILRHDRAKGELEDEEEEN